jgi:hypothetical protein
MSNVVSFADARRRAGVATLLDDAREMIAQNGPRAGLIAAICARTPETPDDERPYWIALAEEIERIEGYAWYVPDVGTIGGPDRRAPTRPTGRGA